MDMLATNKPKFVTRPLNAILEASVPPLPLLARFARSRMLFCVQSAFALRA
jgi:hypothetical protein